MNDEVILDYYHPVTGMDYAEIGGTFYFKPTFPNQYFADQIVNGLVKSGMTYGFTPK